MVLAWTVNQQGGVGDVFLIDCDIPRPNSSKNVIGWQSIIKNVDNCCRSHKKMIQNRAASSPAQTKANGGVAYRVSGKIDKKYNHNYRQYLKKRCMLPDYYNATGAKKKTFSRVTGHNQYQAPCCGTDCSNGITPPTSTNLHWKRSNWGFYKQGAVDNDIYIAKRKIFTNHQNPCCCACVQVLLVTERHSQHDPGVGDIVTGSGGAGVIISTKVVNIGDNQEYTWALYVKLDDCSAPFVHDGDDISISGHPTNPTIGSDRWEAGDINGPTCSLRPYRTPQFPQDNPKNFNHNKNNLSNNF